MGIQRNLGTTRTPPYLETRKLMWENAFPFAVVTLTPHSVAHRICPESEHV